ncbi:ecdysteroid kinase domain-containing protein [Ditylenchus destructor]|uniref:Ecdysteroid kinase domain-containing protein n=1 Tax=Ditylenchus destructor TaxID=166010 RepID=A0AAD4R9H5_9BILA|nr:ecdysteroid kinase domain-containing protein [Ditylenchus destructor]
MGIDLNKIIDSSCKDFTVGFVISKLDGKNTLWDCHRSSHEIKNVEVSLLDTSGFMSDIYSVLFEFTANSSALSFTVIFKFHRAEVRFYEEVVPRISQHFTKFIVPQAYYTNMAVSSADLTGAVVLMQEIRNAGSVPLHAGLSRDQVESAICAIAQFHALSLTLPDEFIDSFPFQSDCDIEEEVCQMTNRLTSLPENEVAEYFKNNQSCLSNVLNRYGKFLSDQHKLFGTRPMLSHGDFWQSNLFFEKNIDGSIGSKISAFIDWQVMYAGTGINDVVRLVLVGVDAELRREQMENWLNMYYTALHHEIAVINKLHKPANPIICPYNDFATIQRIAQYHSHYETLFSLFLCANILGALKDVSQRKKLLNRMVDGFLPVLVKFHNQETRFYNAIGNSYPSPVIPKVFASRECTNPEELERSFLIMQDRKTSGGVHADFSQGLSKRQIESVLAAMAEFHAYTLSLSSQLMESLVLEKPLEFGEGSETLLKNLLKIPDADAQYFANNETVLRKFFATHAKESFFDCHKRFGIKPVLCHGDLWTNNIFYKTSDISDSSDELHSIFDWQCVHPNTGLNDIAHFLLSGATAELLSQHEHEWLQLYFDVFAKKASELGVEPPCDFELMEKIYQYHYPAQLMFVMLVIEVVLNAEHRPEMRRNLIHRMIAGFEKIRRNYE